MYLPTFTEPELKLIYSALRLAEADAKKRVRKSHQLLEFVDGKSPRTLNQLQYQEDRQEKCHNLAERLGTWLDKHAKSDHRA